MVVSPETEKGLAGAGAAGLTQMSQRPFTFLQALPILRRGHREIQSPVSLEANLEEVWGDHIGHSAGVMQGGSLIEPKHELIRVLQGRGGQQGTQ